MTEKILKIIFFFLLLVLIGEIIFLFFFSQKNFQENLKNTNQKITTDKILKTKNEENSETSSLDYQVAKKYLENIKKQAKIGLLKKAQIISEYEGEIVNIQQKDIDTSIFFGGYQPVLKIDVKIPLLKNDYKQLSLYFDQYEYNNALVYDKNNNKLSLSDLKVGQFIKVKKEFELTNDNKWVIYTIFIEK
jgi:uncharacterized protein YneF (UPF0154 family)